MKTEIGQFYKAQGTRWAGFVVVLGPEITMPCGGALVPCETIPNPNTSEKPNTTLFWVKSLSLAANHFFCDKLNWDEWEVPSDKAPDGLVGLDPTTKLWFSWTRSLSSDQPPALRLHADYSKAKQFVRSVFKAEVEE